MVGLAGCFIYTGWADMGPGRGLWGMDRTPPTPGVRDRAELRKQIVCSKRECKPQKTLVGGTRATKCGSNISDGQERDLARKYGGESLSPTTLA